MKSSFTLVLTLALAISVCGTGAARASSAHRIAQEMPSHSCAAAVAYHARSRWAPKPLPAGLTLSNGFTGEIVAHVPDARELAFAPNGDLFVGTKGANVYVVSDADAAGSAVDARVFWSHPASDNNGDAPNAGVAFSLANCALYVGSNTGVWRVPYRARGTAGPAQRIVAVRTGPVSPNTDGDIHSTTSVALTQGSLFVSVGSSCNKCVEVDPTRAVVLQTTPNGGAVSTRAKHIRNAIALAIDPLSGHLWVAGAGQDTLPFGHPYEFADDLSARAGTADYGWPDCEENHVAYVHGAHCSGVVVPLVEIPAYSTIIGATFYPLNQRGAHAFPAQYRGGLFLTAHGSWHRTTGGSYAALPQVVFVRMNGDRPSRTVRWSNPTTQWRTFFGGFVAGGLARIGRPTGIAVGPNGSLFVADDQTGNIYRIRPAR